MGSLCCVGPIIDTRRCPSPNPDDVGATLPGSSVRSSASTSAMKGQSVVSAPMVDRLLLGRRFADPGVTAEGLGGDQRDPGRSRGRSIARRRTCFVGGSRAEKAPVTLAIEGRFSGSNSPAFTGTAARHPRWGFKRHGQKGAHGEEEGFSRPGPFQDVWECLREREVSCNCLEIGINPALDRQVHGHKKVR